MRPDDDAANSAWHRAETICDGRYRLVDQVGGGSGWQAWKAVDVRLARPVTVQAFDQGFPGAEAAVAAARAASRVSDARLARVFDAVADHGRVFVVTEWPGGDSLADLLAAGPLDPEQATEIVIQASEALASAHAAGVAHECLTPDCVRWTPGVGVTITGLGIDAALTAARTSDRGGHSPGPGSLGPGNPGLADTRGLARLLYAALTARWPGGGWPFLPPAPEVGGYPRSPRQVRAGVPAGLAGLCCQVLVPGRYAEPPVTTPAALAAALHRIAATADRHRPPPSRAPAGTTGRRPAAARVMASIAAVLAVAAVGQGTWSWWHPRAVADANNTVSQYHWPPGATVLTPVAAAGFDPLSSPAEDPGNENTDQAHLAVDGNPATAWHTQYYLGNPRFGGLKSGTGLLLDMGRRVRVSSVAVTLGPVPGADLRMEVGNSGTRTPATLRGFTTVARQRNASGTVTFSARPAEARFVLLWFTRLPPQTPGSTGLFQAEIFNVVVRGSR